MLFIRLYFPKYKIVIGVHDVIEHAGFGNYFTKFNNFYMFRLFENYHLFSNSQKEIFDKKYPLKNNFVAKMYLKDFGKRKFSKKRGRPNYFSFFWHN